MSDVKRFESFVITDPITLREFNTVREARELQDKFNITGFPVISDNKKLVGIVTNRDMRFSTDDSTPVASIMTRNDLATINSCSDPKQAKSIMASGE